ncbi:MAG: NADH-quinone oxidoreductase subunit C [Chitinispirillaceae bacterium]|jgi:Ni,Fe-hydrogenase III large subunit/Ni,Fe-hydrogenase III component G|nr:NADH-quinone oxidoreductase subunit C [Chitinispirillaceae bacterium]
MNAREILDILDDRFAKDLIRSDIPSDSRLFVYLKRESLREVAAYVFRDLDARYAVGIGIDDRDVSGNYMVSHQFCFDSDNVIMSLIVPMHADDPTLPSISDIVPAAGWSEREMRDLVGITAKGMTNPKRLVLPDGWPENLHPLRKDVAWNVKPADYDDTKTYPFDEAPPGTTVVPFGPFHPTLDEPEHFRLFVEGEIVRGCEYRGFMVHRGIEKLADSVMTYNEIPMLAERICGICGCVHAVAYAQAVEQAANVRPTLRAEYIRTIMLELERLHSHTLWTGLASHILGFDTLFMQAFRIREPVMWISEKISGNRKTYALCVIGGVRFDITPDLRSELRAVMDKLESEWRAVFKAIKGDKNIQARTSGIGVADKTLCKNMGLLGPIARSAGIPIDARHDHPYAAYDKVDFKVITHDTCDVWGRIVVRVLEVFESIKIIRQCLDKMPEGPIAAEPTSELPAGRMGVSAVEAPRGESHHFLITGENNRPHRWRVRAPTYQNLQGVPAMIRDQRISDMTITLGSIDPCFSCTDRMEIVDIKTGNMKIWTPNKQQQQPKVTVRKRV